MASLLERRFSFYAAYHQNEANQNIHIVCVPLIYWCALILVSVLLPCSLSTVIPGVPEAINVVGVAIPIDASFVAVLVYFLYYIVLSPVLAVSALAAGRATPSPLTLLCCAPVLQLCTTFLLSTALVGATVAVLQLGPTLAVRVAAVVHVVGWLAQFYGHGHYEGRAPALLDSLIESLMMAPLFICIEIGFRAGFLKEFKSLVDTLVAQRQRELFNKKA